MSRAQTVLIRSLFVVLFTATISWGASPTFPHSTAENAPASAVPPAAPPGDATPDGSKKADPNDAGGGRERNANWLLDAATYFESGATLLGGLSAAIAAATILTKRGRRLLVEFSRVIRDALDEPKKAEDARRALQEKLDRVPRIEEIKAKFPQRFTQQISVGDNAAQAAEDAKLVVLASGKGGVGKSTLALGLLEKWAEAGKTTLLVDFDLHNRGLTSLLHAQESAHGSSSVLKEAGRFESECGQELRQILGDERNQPNGEGGVDLSQQVLKLMDKFARNKFGDGQEATFKPLPATQFLGLGGPQVRISARRSVNRRDPWFLRSAAKEEHYLGSEIFDFSSNQTFFFLKFFQYWAAHCPSHFDRIILDCHGAQDRLMIGAIHAASGLVVTTTPDPGAFDGSYDLFAFADLLRSNRQVRLPTMIAINNFQDWQKENADAIVEFATTSAPGRPTLADSSVKLSYSGHVRKVANAYTFGDACAQPEVDRACEKIVEHFEQLWEPHSTKPPEIRAQGPAA